VPVPVVVTPDHPVAPSPGGTAAGRSHRPSGPVLDGTPRLRIVPWEDPVADPHGVHPGSRYVELYWLPVIGPSATWLLRRLSYGLEMQAGGFDLDLGETARSLGLGDRLSKNAPFRRALLRLCTFELARAHGVGGLAVRTRIPPLPLRHLERLPVSLQLSHRRWLEEQRLSGPEQMRRRAGRLAAGLAASGLDRADIERRLAGWQFHPAVAYRAADEAVGAATASGQESSSRLTASGTSASPAGPAQAPSGVPSDRANASEVASSTSRRTPNPVPPLVR